MIKIEFDPVKSGKNIEERGLAFELASEFEFETAVIRIDNRKQYGELRFNALGYIGKRLYSITYTLRVDTLRVISLRKANKREIRYYAET
jgi:uncharacterized protein